MDERRKVLEAFEAQHAFIQEKAKNIETYRKADAFVKLQDKQGNPIRNGQVSVKQVGHAFKYGANLFMLDELETEEKNRQYRKIMADFGNMATLPFYWDATEPERGKTRYGKDSVRIYRRPPIDRCMEFCREHGIEPREHALAYEGFFPKWLYDASVEEIKEALELRYQQISQRYAHQIPTIEVTNEMKWSKGRTRFYDQADYVKWCFDTAEKYFPHNQLVINDVTRLSWSDPGRATDQYYAYIEANLLKGVRIDAIGLQFHMFFPRDVEYDKTRPYYDPQKLYKHMDLYANLGKPLQITEVTVPAYSWEPGDEQLQAEILEHLYTLWFSHPGVEQIIYWNMVDGYAHLWDPDPVKIRASQGDMTLGENYYYGGLLRFDMTPKPAYFTIKRLFEEVWHTELSLLSNEMGSAQFRGFCGDYEITVKGKTHRVTIDKHGDNSFVIEV